MIETDTYAAYLSREGRGIGEKVLGGSCDFDIQASIKANGGNLQKRSWNFQKVDRNFGGKYERILGILG